MQVWSLQGSAQILLVTGIENAGADKQDLQLKAVQIHFQKRKSPL